jgi:hypothetical protein
MPSHDDILHSHKAQDTLPENYDDIIGCLAQLAQDLKCVESIESHDERRVLQLIDKLNKLQMGQSVGKDQSVKVGSLLFEFLCKKASNSFHRFLHGQIMRNPSEVLIGIKEAILVTVKMADAKKIEYSICFRLYLSIFARSIVDNSISNGMRMSDSIWPELMTYCDTFFERPPNDKIFYVKDLSKHPAFKSIASKTFESASHLSSITDFLVYCYLMHVALNYLEIYADLLDDSESKITQASKNSILAFLVKCAISTSILQNRILQSSFFRGNTGSYLNRITLDYVRGLLEKEGAMVQLFTCERCMGDYLREDHIPTYFEGKAICEVCLLTLGTKDEKETTREQQEQPVTASLPEQEQDPNADPSNRVVISDNSHGVLMAILCNELCPDKLFGSSFETFFNTTDHCYNITIETKAEHPNNIESELFEVIALRKLTEYEWLISRKTHDLLLYFATQRTAHNNFGVVAERIRRITKRFPLMLLSPKYFNIVTLLQHEKNPDIRSFVLSMYLHLIETVPITILGRFRFKSKAVFDQVQDFCFSCLAHHSPELKKQAMLAISTMIDSGVLRFNFIDSKAAFKSRMLSDDPKTSSKDRNRKSGIETPSSPVAVNDAGLIVACFISDEQLKGLLNVCANSKDEEMTTNVLTIVLKLVGFIDQENTNLSKNTVVTEELSVEKPPTRSAYKTVTKNIKEDESNIKISKSKKSKINEEKVNELVSRVLTLVILKPPSPLDKLSSYWLVSFFKNFYLQILPEIRAIVQKLISRHELMQDQASLTLLYSILFNEKSIKTTSVLCEVAIVLTSALNTILKTEESMANFENFEFGNSTFGRLEDRQKEIVNLQARCLISTLSVLNKHELNLFYKEPVNGLLIFLGLRMFEFPLKMFKLLVKVKIMIDLNFQIFQNIEISLRKNTNFLSLTLNQISSSFPQTGTPEPLQLSYGTLIPVIKCIHFVRKLLEMMPRNIFNESFMCLVFGLIVKMAEVPERNLIQESGLVLPLFFDLGILKMNVVYEIMDKVMVHDFGLKAVLFISSKLVKKNRGQGFVGLLWRRYVDRIYNNIETRLFGHRASAASMKESIGEQSNSHPLLNEAELINALETILFLAKNKEVDLVRLFVLANGWIFSRIKKCSMISSQIVAEILTLDSRISSNKGTIFDVLRRMAISFTHFQNDTLSNFVEAFHESFSMGKKISLQNFFAAAIEIIFEFGSNQSHPDSKMMEEAFDMFMLAILISSPENFKITFLAKAGDALICSINRLQAEYMIVKKQFVQPKSDVKRKSGQSIPPNDTDAMALPKRMVKNIYYLLWICSTIYYEIEKVDTTSNETRLKDQLREKYLVDSLKVLKDATQKKGITTVENDPRFLLLLSQKLDNINFLDNFKVLKKVIDKLENNPLMNLIDIDEFNRDLLFLSQSRPKPTKAQRTSHHAPVRPQSKTPAKKIKRMPKTANVKKIKPLDTSNKKPQTQNKAPEAPPRYGYRRSVMEKRLDNF